MKRTLAAIMGISLLIFSSLGLACVMPTADQVQPQQVYVRKDADYFYWMVVYASPLPTGVICADNEGGRMVGLSFGLATSAGMSGIWMEGRVHALPDGTYSTKIFTPTYQQDDPAVVSGRTVIGQLSLAKMAQAGITLPSDVSSIHYVSFFYYGVDGSALGAVGPNNSDGNKTRTLASLTNEWQQVQGETAPAPVDPHAGTSIQATNSGGSRSAYSLGVTFTLSSADSNRPMNLYVAALVGSQWFFEDAQGGWEPYTGGALVPIVSGATMTSGAFTFKIADAMDVSSPALTGTQIYAGFAVDDQELLANLGTQTKLLATLQ